jgi:hypothetical protein
VDDLGQDRQLLKRVSERLRSMSEPALGRRRDELDGESVAEAVRRVCTWAAAQQGIEAQVPVLHPLASGDQLAVIGREFLDWVHTASATDALSTWRTEVDRIRRVA